METQKHNTQGNGRDERLTAILGPIYKVGFQIMALGILFDIYTRFNYLAQSNVEGGALAQNTFEALVLMAACLTVGIMMRRRNVYSDSLRYTEASSFGKTGGVASSALTAALIAAAATLGRLHNEIIRFGWDGVTWLGDLAMFVVVFLIFGALILVVQYFVWRSYRKWEDLAIEQED